MERYFVVKKSSALRVSSETKTSDSKTKTTTKRYQPYANARREHASSSSSSGSSSSSRTRASTSTETTTQNQSGTREVSSLSPTPTRHDDDYDNNNDHNDHDIDNTNTNTNTNVTDLKKNLSTKDLTHLVLSTLSHRSNPITHSDIYERTEHIVSAASGHQRGDGRVNGGHKAWFDHRSSKLNEQRNAEAMRTASSSTSNTIHSDSKNSRNTSNTNAHAKTNANANGNSKASVLQGVRVYINGYLRNTTDIEMKRIVIGAGGSILLTPSGATHILTSQQLSGSKTHRVLTGKKRCHVHVVRPEWVMDSIEAGRKVKEVDYAVIRDVRTQRIEDMFGKT